MVFFNYFKEHFKKDQWRKPTISSFGFIRLSEEEKHVLEKAFSPDEVWDVVCSCDGNKAPRMDRLNMNFVKTNSEDSKTTTILKDGMEVVVGRGNMIIFWNDFRWDSRSLMEVIPRIFALSTNKRGYLQDFGLCLKVRHLIQDIVAWKFNSNGSFTVNSFRKFLEAFASNDLYVSSILWNGCSHYKVEIFVGQLLKGRVLVRDVINRFGFIQDLYTYLVKISKPSLEAWKHPPVGDLKFNVNISARGKPGPTSIGGVLRDWRGQVLGIFSLFIGIQILELNRDFGNTQSM
ncbi:hypothetical protein Dsin_013533 [Dipteronia sinensis]|uniref:Uncharacterized protein n=1 Tax=Dipteronia sinensis TaxID=43782 RepID=A0AAE0E8Z4_9ROSI|nr:hypothetical protein Dsin_013533 [Dipteronia sinensis]